MNLIKIDKSLCIKCGICTKVCPAGVLCMNENIPQEIDSNPCIACGQCVAVCPHGAIDNVKTPLSNQVNINNSSVINSQAAEQFLRSRRSIRCYKDTPVPKERLLELVDITRFAPTASNSQGISYIIISDKKLLGNVTKIVMEWMEKQLGNPSHWSFERHFHNYRKTGIDTVLRNAPHLILAIASRDFKNRRENTIFSFSYLELFAPTLGLGSCFAGLFEMCAFSNYYPLFELFNIPTDKAITGAVMVGYPKYKYKRLVDRNPIDVTYID